MKFTLCFLWLLILLMSYIRNHYPMVRSWRFSPMLSSKNFIVFTLEYRTWIHVEFIFMYQVRQGSIFSSFACGCAVVSAPFVEKTVSSFTPEFSSAPLSKINWLQVYEFISQFCSIDLHIFILMPEPHSLDYFNFVLSFGKEVKETWDLQLCSF